MSKIKSTSWFRADQLEVAGAVFSELGRIQQEQASRRARNITCLKLYGNMDYNGIYPSTYSQGISMPGDRVKYNLVASCVDTISAKISKLKTKVTFLTDGGTWGAKTKAKNLTKFVYGLFTANKVWNLHQKGFKDGTIFDIGAIKHFRYGKNKIRSERVLPTEIHFDLVDSVYGTPTVCYQQKNVDKEALIEMFPDRKGVIMASSVMDNANNPVSLDLKGQVTVVESWRLPSVEDGDDGRHVIVVNGGYLVDEPWTKNYFPFTFFRWSEMPVGFYGQSLADRLTGNQVELNKILRVIQKSLHLGAVYKIFVEYGSKIVKEQFNNEIGTMIYYAGTKPSIEIPKVVSEEMFRHMSWLIDKGYEETGVSQLSASAKKPSGLDAKVALREFQDIETERFALVAMAYEDSFLETARQYIELAKEIDADNEELEAVAESKRFINKISWKDVAVEDNEYIMQRFPSSSLPNTPAGKLQYVKELIEGGMMDPKWAMHLIDIPDTDSYVSLQTASLEMILDCIDQIVTKQRYIGPEPYFDLDSGLTLMQAAYNRARIDEAPEEVLEMLRDWMSAANGLIEKKQAEQQAQQMAQQPPAAPQPTAPTGGINPSEQVAI